MIRITIDRVVVEGLALTQAEIRQRLETAFAGLESPDENEIVKRVREAFDA